MDKTRKDIANKFREIRKSLDDFKSVRSLVELAQMVDRKIEWILNILIINFDDEKYGPINVDLDSLEREEMIKATDNVLMKDLRLE